MILCNVLHNLEDFGTSIHIDCAPGLVTVTNDCTVRQYGIQLETGNVENPNKSQVAKKATDELELELLHVSPEGGASRCHCKH